MYDAFLASYKSDDLVIKKKVLTIKKTSCVAHFENHCHTDCEII